MVAATRRESSCLSRLRRVWSGGWDRYGPPGPDAGPSPACAGIAIRGAVTAAAAVTAPAVSNSRRVAVGRAGRGNSWGSIPRILAFGSMTVHTWELPHALGEG